MAHPPPALDTLELHPGAPPVASIVMLHGLGADGHDFWPLVEALDLSRVGPVRWLLPRAPVQPVTINGGMAMRSWYDIVGADLARREDETGLRRSFDAVRALLRREVARGMPSHRIVLAGFSQGCAVTLGAGLRHEQALAGLVGLSGYLPLAASTETERHGANQATPVFLGHGRRDEVVPLARGADARDRLRTLGHPVHWHEDEVDHALSPHEVMAMQAWLLERLLP